MKETANYANSKVLILGGGDGGLLKELLELPQPPKQVIMIDLDDAVMVGCAEHMTSVSGSYMDKGKRKGSNYEVICGDAIEYMEKAKVRLVMLIIVILILQLCIYVCIYIMTYLCFLMFRKEVKSSILFSGI